ncbi:hypothetical protein CNAG_01493 [Cryptococcus neoformans var. grubii H99]|uniref:Uncharacterized protein n=1 Tax=Cryptococcus neoformans (strain H99 / ATCC 208821 / CBS 10515 / FGSC 9487) TaxID=235443 RepID=J9VYH1_CRYN9|nr:hypothetical protein CNAG_01493 [Cryptococcus neoformans var. grubii H99]AFR97699.1 hypothetical protein CNAG_01493 [Cryptococcus neoformans var. grubii H99]AUB27751.1 hypothetical protein CKF44_01493 [Cryptococcus neoformans var. grubii]|eukprot:XP_012052559.1 hypothetical protein CNAG_01493 [Cryptococcus neoformans var. grubii H99]
MQQPFARLSRLLIYNSSRPFSPLRGAVIRTRRLYSTEIPPPPPVTPTPSGNAKRRWGLVFIIAGLTASSGYVFVRNDTVLEYRLDQLSQKIMGRPDEKQLFEERRRIDEEARRRFVEPPTRRIV